MKFMEARERGNPRFERFGYRVLMETTNNLL